MNALMHTRLPFHAVAIFCVIAVYLSFRYGYTKHDRDFVREQRRIHKREQARLPKAIR